MGFDEERLSYDSVLYLLDLSEYEGGRRRATDMNWSSKIYNTVFANNLWCKKISQFYIGRKMTRAMAPKDLL